MSDDRTVYVGNLTDKVTESIVLELLIQAGPVEEIVFKQPKGGYPFAFVTFVHDVSPGYAVALLNGVKLFGRPITVQDKSEEPDLKYPNMIEEYFRKNRPERHSQNDYRDRSGPSMESPNHYRTQRPQYGRDDRPFEDFRGYHGRPYSGDSRMTGYSNGDSGHYHDHRSDRFPEHEYRRDHSNDRLRHPRYSAPMPRDYDYDRRSHRHDEHRKRHDSDHNWRYSYDEKRSRRS